ncbi:MAG: hypothetical protein Q9219_004805 [cf. Caloplaca sp. 3 TL-2023]
MVANLRELYLQARPGGKMAAYRYTTKPGEDTSWHDNFIAKFAQLAMTLVIQDVYALMVKGSYQDALPDFEMSIVASTILVSNSVWSPLADSEISTTTDAIATPDYAAADSVPGIISVKCIKTRSGKHFNITCSKTTSGTHYQQKSAMPGGELLLTGEPLAEDSEAIAITSRARALVEAF